MIYDNRRCELGEGPLWHPLRDQLFWFDILGRRMLSVEKGQQRQWDFPELVSAAAWVDRDRLVIAGESGLILYDVETGKTQGLASLEADSPGTRSNDGRADAWAASGSARWARRPSRAPGRSIAITVANCAGFIPKSPSRTPSAFRPMAAPGISPIRRPARSCGWHLTRRAGRAGAEVYLDLQSEGLNPDGAVIDAQGLMWLAEWGAARVAAYAPDGPCPPRRFRPPHTSCPAFGGPGLTTLFCTTALQDMDAAARAAHPHAGMTMMAERIATGQAEHRVQP